MVKRRVQWQLGTLMAAGRGSFPAIVTTGYFLDSFEGGHFLADIPPSTEKYRKIKWMVFHPLWIVGTPEMVQVDR